MGFEARTIFPGVLLEGAERVAKHSASNETATRADLIQEMGWGATLICEKKGGYGGSFKDIGSLMEGLASRAINLPIDTRCCIVPGMLQAAPASDSVEALLSAIAEGTASVEWAGPLSWRQSDELPELSPTAQGWRIDGRLENIEWTDCCSHVLFCAINTTTQTHCVVVADASCLPAPARAFTTVDQRSVKQFELAAMELDRDSILAQGDAALAMSRAGWKLAQVSVGTQIVCTMNYALSETVPYLQERKQFGQPLAQLQVLRHEVAKLYVIFETCKSLLMATLRSTEDSGDDSANRAAYDLLGVYVREQAVVFAQAVIQLHGGMGMALETLAARMASRLIAYAFRFGDTYSHTKALTRFQAGLEQ